jgi:hypothetical protein
MNKLIYPSHFEIIKNLDENQAGQLIKKIGDSSYEITDPFVKGLYMGMEYDFIKQEENYNLMVERNRENGKRGGRPKTKENPNNPTGSLQTQETQVVILETQQNPENLKYKDKDKDSSLSLSDKEAYRTLGGYGKFLETFPHHKVRGIEEGNEIWNTFSQDEKKEVMRHCKIYVKDYIDKNQEQYMKNTLAYLQSDMWLDMKPRELIKKPVNRGMVNMTFVSFVSRLNNISTDESQKFLYRTSTDSEFSKLYKQYQDYQTKHFLNK